MLQSTGAQCCPNTSVSPRATCINAPCPFLVSARGKKQNKPSQPNHLYLSSLATSLCWESSRISGKLVIISCWIGTGETLIICINFLTRSCRQEEHWWNAQISQHNNNIMHIRSLSATSAWIYANCALTHCPAEVVKQSRLLWNNGILQPGYNDLGEQREARWVSQCLVLQQRVTHRDPLN